MQLVWLRWRQGFKKLVKLDARWMHFGPSGMEWHWWHVKGSWLLLPSPTNDVLDAFIATSWWCPPVLPSKLKPDTAKKQQQERRSSNANSIPTTDAMAALVRMIPQNTTTKKSLRSNDDPRGARKSARSRLRSTSSETHFASVVCCNHSRVPENGSERKESPGNYHGGPYGCCCCAVCGRCFWSLPIDPVTNLPPAGTPPKLQINEDRWFLFSASNLIKRRRIIFDSIIQRGAAQRFIIGLTSAGASSIDKVI